MIDIECLRMDTNSQNNIDLLATAFNNDTFENFFLNNDLFLNDKQQQQQQNDEPEINEQTKIINNNNNNNNNISIDEISVSSKADDKNLNKKKRKLKNKIENVKDNNNKKARKNTFQRKNIKYIIVLCDLNRQFDF